MDVRDNPNFLRVSKYNLPVTMEQLLHSIPTNHYYERLQRIQLAIQVNAGAEIDCCFLVDKGHPNGAELHHVTRNGIVFITNQRTGKLITVLIARPNQISRLYKECNMQVDAVILAKALKNVEKNLNNI